MHVVPVLVQVVVTCVHVMYMYMLLQQGHTQLHNIVACVNGVCPVQYYGQLTATSLSQLHSPDFLGNMEQYAKFMLQFPLY